MDNIPAVVRFYLRRKILRLRRSYLYSISQRRNIKQFIAARLLHYEKQRRQLAYNPGKRMRRWHARPFLVHRKVYGAWYSLIPMMKEFDRHEYFRFMRMTPECFDWLLERVSPIIKKTSMRESISPGERLPVTLRYLASGDSQSSLSYLFRIANQTISKIITETTSAIWFVLKPLVFEPISQDMWRQKAAEFEVMWNFPMCVGALDGKHCVFQKFPSRGSEDYNYKGAHSIVLMALCDAKYKFIVIDVGAKGREGDSGVFARSEFGKLFFAHKLQFPHRAYNESIDDTLHYCIVGDNAFPLHQHLLKPFEESKQFKEEEIIFNYRLSRARRVIENAFGVLSARFRILRHTTIASETLAQNIVLATCALHNLHLQREDSIPPKQRVHMPPGYADTYKSNGFINLGRWRHELKDGEVSVFEKLVANEVAPPNSTVHDPLTAILNREKFVKYFMAKPVPWQWEILNLGLLL